MAISSKPLNMAEKRSTTPSVQPQRRGRPVVVPNSKVRAEQERNPMFKFAPGTTLDEIVRAVNQVGAAPSDLMAILEALRQAGALQAELIVI